MFGQEDKMWEIELGLYPGVLIGFRTYDMGTHNTHVIYLPFVDIALNIEK